MPPRLAHWGESLDESITYSVGLRTPTAQEVLYDLAIELESQGQTKFVHDTQPKPATNETEILEQDVFAVQQLLREIVDDDALIGDWLARYMSRPKYEEMVEITEEERTATFNGITYKNGDPIA